MERTSLRKLDGIQAANNKEEAMSVRVYLIGDKAKDLPGFDTIPRPDYGPNSKEYVADGDIKLYRENGRWYIAVGSIADPIPPQVLDIVDEISFRDWVPKLSERQFGVYHLVTAEAEVDLDNGDKKPRLEISIRAKNMEDVRDLYHRIRVGSISPKPEDSYTNPQVATPSAAESSELQRLLRKERILMDIEDGLDEFIANAALSRFPLMRRKGVLNALRQIVKPARSI
jgi:hypothetical protein